MGACNIFSTQGHIPARIGKGGTATFFAWKGITLPEYWWGTEQMMTALGADGCDQLDDGGGLSTLFLHRGAEAEVADAKNGTLPDPEDTTYPEFEVKMQVVKDSFAADTT